MTGLDSITIRPSGSADMGALERLAQLDSQRVPVDDFLVAEVAGRPLAALGVASGTVVADPFRPTAAATELLRLRAAQGRAACRSRRRLSRPLLAAVLTRHRAAAEQVACA